MDSHGSDPEASISSWGIDEQGWIVVRFADETVAQVGRVALWHPAPTTRLRRVSESDFIDPDLPSDWATRLTVPDGSLVSLRRGHLEQPPPDLQIALFDTARPFDPAVFPVRVGLPFCIFIDGPGMLQVRDPDTDDFFMTRCGALKADWHGWLVTMPEGFRVQGLTNLALNQRGDVRLDVADRPMHSDPNSRLASAAIDHDGTIIAHLSDGTIYPRARLLLETALAPQDLRPAQEAMWIPVHRPDPALEAHDTRSPHAPRTRMIAGSLDPRYLTPRRSAALRRLMGFQQRAITRTTIPTHLAISGHGFFLLRDPKNGRFLVTRWGVFQWSEDGHLEGIHGWRVQARSLSDPDLDPFDLRTATGKPPESDSEFQIQGDGSLLQTRADASDSIATAVLIIDIPDPSTLDDAAPLHYLVPSPPERLGEWLRSLEACESTYHRVLGSALELLWEPLEFLEDVLPPAGTQLRVFGMAGRRLTIQVSHDLAHWQDWITSNELGVLSEPWLSLDGPFAMAPAVVGNQIFDPSAARNGQRFYRLIHE